MISIDRSAEEQWHALGQSQDQNWAQSIMWRTGGRSSILSPLRLRLRLLLLVRRRRAAAASTLSQPPPRASPARLDQALGPPLATLGRVHNVPYWQQQQRAGISIAGDGAGSHDDFKPVQKGGSSVPSVQEHIEKDIKENAVLVYMKGVPEEPHCGFSAMVVRILDEHGVQYKTRNVLTDPELRNAIKEHSKWPTIPQVYVHGEFVGGSDILIAMHRSGELGRLLKDVKKRR